MKSSYLFSPLAPGAASWKRLGTGEDKAEKGGSWQECAVKALRLIQIHDCLAEAFPVGTEIRSLLHSPASAVPGEQLSTAAVGPRVSTCTPGALGAEVRPWAGLCLLSPTLWSNQQGRAILLEASVHA